METFFVSQSLTNVLFLHLNSSITSKHVFIAVGDFRARKKTFETRYFRFNFPRSTQAKVKFPRPRRPSRQIHHPRAQKIVKRPGFPGECWSFNLIGALRHDNTGHNSSFLFATRLNTRRHERNFSRKEAKHFLVRQNKWGGGGIRPHERIENTLRNWNVSTTRTKDSSVFSDLTP